MRQVLLLDAWGNCCPSPPPLEHGELRGEHAHCLAQWSHRRVVKAQSSHSGHSTVVNNCRPSESRYSTVVTTVNTAQWTQPQHKAHSTVITAQWVQPGRCHSHSSHITVGTAQSPQHSGHSTVARHDTVVTTRSPQRGASFRRSRTLIMVPLLLAVSLCRFLSQLLIEFVLK